MKYIGPNETNKTEERTDITYTIHLDGFDQLIESRNNGEFAVWEYGGYIATTDDVPENIDELEYTQVIREMKSKIFERHIKLEAAKTKKSARTKKATH